MPSREQVRSVSFSELDAFRQCPHKHDLEYKQLWQPPEPSEALARGSLWHEVMAAHYMILRQGLPKKTLAKTLEKTVRPLLGVPGEQTERQDLVEWMYTGYVRAYGLDEEWKILAIEQKLNHPLAKKLKLNGTIDLVVRDANGLWLVDHKTAKDLPNERKLELDDQMGLYAWLLRKLGKPVVGIYYNVARTYRFVDASKQRLEDRFARIPLNRTDDEMETIAQEAIATAREMEGSKGERNTGEHCIFRCSFTEACLAGRRGLNEAEFLKASGFRKETPRYGKEREHGKG